jgi:hypothetical protein
MQQRLSSLVPDEAMGKHSTSALAGSWLPGGQGGAQLVQAGCAAGLGWRQQAM